MDGRQQHVDDDGGGEHGVDGAEERADPPGVTADDLKEDAVHQREEDAEHEVEDVADRARLAAVVGHRGAEQQRQVHARQRHLARGLDDRREDEGAEKAAGDRGCDH